MKLTRNAVLLIYPSLAVQFDRSRIETDNDRRTLLVRIVFCAMSFKKSNASSDFPASNPLSRLSQLCPFARWKVY